MKVDYTANLPPLPLPVRKGTWLEGSRLEFRKVAMFIYCWSKQLTSIKFCDNELDIGKTCVIDWNNYLREVCANTLIQNPVVIGILSDEWRAYRGIQNMGMGMNMVHSTVNHTYNLNFVDPVTGTHTQTIVNVESS